MEDKFDRQSVESCHENTSESEIECNHKKPDGSSAWRVLLGRCVMQCSICGDENDLNPLLTPQLQEPRDGAGFGSQGSVYLTADRTATDDEVVTALFLQAIRIQAKYLDAGDL